MSLFFSDLETGRYVGGPKDYLIRRRQHGKAGGGSTHVHQSDDVVENPTCVCREGRILFFDSCSGKTRFGLVFIGQSSQY